MLIVPTVLFPPVMPFTAQMTLWLVEPVVVAVKVAVSPVSSVAVTGAIETETVGVANAAARPPPQSRINKAWTTINAAIMMDRNFCGSDKKPLPFLLPYGADFGLGSQYGSTCLPNAYNYCSQATASRHRRFLALGLARKSHR